MTDEQWDQLNDWLTTSSIEDAIVNILGTNYEEKTYEPAEDK